MELSPQNYYQHEFMGWALSIHERSVLLFHLFL